MDFDVAVVPVELPLIFVSKGQKSANIFPKHAILGIENAEQECVE